MPIIITSKQHLFRRCGVAHPKEPTEYPEDRFTAEEGKMLLAEPMLSIQFIEADKVPDPEKEPEGPDPAKKTTKKSRK